MLQLLEAAAEQEIFHTLHNRIISREAQISIIGLGYVGLPEAVEFAQAGFTVTGIDVSAKKVKSLQQGISYIQDVDSEQVKSLVAIDRLRATTNFAGIADADVIIICVPTPLKKSKDPDMSFINSAVAEIKKYLHAGQLVVLESTTYPGTTTELLMPAFAELGLCAGKDIFLVFSPERVDPGNARYHTRNIPKIVGGVSSFCTQLATALYQQAVEKVVPVSSPEIAEMAKLLENTFRSVNIGLVNEFAMMCRMLKLNIWEVIQAASTKPFGFMPFYPGPGVGGHCIPLDPFYLSWKARTIGFDSRFIELAGQINSQMPHYVLSLIIDGLNDHNKCLRDARVHVMGVAYKKDIGDLRESPALEVIQLLIAKGAVVTYSDPHVPELHIGEQKLFAVAPEDHLLADSDCVVILTNHSLFNYRKLAESARLIVDTHNAMAGFDTKNIVRL